MYAHPRIALFETISTVLVSASYLFCLLRYEIFNVSFFDVAASANFTLDQFFDLKRGLQSVFDKLIAFFVKNYTRCFFTGILTPFLCGVMNFYYFSVICCFIIITNSTPLPPRPTARPASCMRSEAN